MAIVLNGGIFSIDYVRGQLSSGIIPKIVIGAMSGNNGSNITNCERVIVSTDTVAMPVRQAVVIARRFCGGAANSQFSWICGGQSITNVERFNLTADDSSSIPRGSLVTGKGCPTALTDGISAWLAPNTAERMIFANDSVTMVQKGTFPVASGVCGTATTKYHGHAIGGTSGNTAVDRLTFSVDTTNAVAKAKLTQGREGPSICQTQTYCTAVGVSDGAGGFASNSERIEYASDTTGPFVRGTSSVSRIDGIGGSTPMEGYVSHGIVGATYITAVERLLFATDTVVTAIKANIAVVRYNSANANPI